MNPSDLGFASSVETFRPAQLEALEYALCCDKRFCAMGLPTGAGKSWVAYALGKLLGGRTVILTATLGLQDQYVQTPVSPKIVTIKGRSNYRCWEGGTCEDGGRLGCGDKAGCPYLGAFRAQEASSMVVTSYAYWLAVNEKGTGIKPPDTLILDEAGIADSWLSRALDFHISERELKEAGIPGKTGEELDVWQSYAPTLQALALRKYQDIKASSLDKYTKMRQLKHAESFMDRAYKLTTLTEENWVCTRLEGEDEGRVWRFECIWPGQYRERLFRGVGKVILMSATLRPKTLSLLGIRREDCEFREWPRQFPPVNGPVIWIPTARLNHKMDVGTEGYKKWISRIDEILQARSVDRRGLIHTVSYVRAKRIEESLGKRYSIILNGAADLESRSAIESFERFKSGKPNSVLCSPSFSTGWDFSGELAEYQIISKLPIPDTRSKIMQARVQRDSSYPNYLTAQELVQACGRIVRFEADRGETIIIDDNIEWFKRVAEPHLPRWFKVRRENTLPPALEKL